MDEFKKLMARFGGAEQMWNYIQRYAAKGGREVTKTVLELFYVMKSPNTGIIDKTLIGAALAYQLLPEDLMPRDKFGILGFLDNGVTLAFAYNRVKKLVTPQIENQVGTILNQWFGEEESNDFGFDGASGLAPAVLGTGGNQSSSPSVDILGRSSSSSNSRNNRFDDDVVID